MELDAKTGGQAMKEYAYYPGCTLKNKALELDRCARAAAEVLGFKLVEIEDWQCCGGVYPMAKNEAAVRLSAVRALAAARDMGLEMLTVCGACYNVMKQTNYDIKHDAPFQTKVNRYLADDAGKDIAVEYHGETQVVHYLEVLRDVIGYEAVKKAVKKPLTGRKIGAYYGCLLLRPSKVMQFDDPENPAVMEDFIRALGAQSVLYAQRNECCGAYTMFDDESVPLSRVKIIVQDAMSHGAEELVTSCPLCQYNLVKNSAKCNQDIKVSYFTELLAEALGVKEGC